MVICIFGRKSYVDQAPVEIQQGLGANPECLRRGCSGFCQAYTVNRWCTWMICIPIFPIRKETIVVCQRCGIKYECAEYIQAQERRRALLARALEAVELARRAHASEQQTVVTAPTDENIPVAVAEIQQPDETQDEKCSLVEATAKEIV